MSHEFDAGIPQEVHQEMNYQVKLWGVQRHAPLLWLAILTEETGEVAKAILENDHQGKPHDPKYAEYRAEIVQVCAVSASMIRSIDLKMREDAE